MRVAVVIVTYNSEGSIGPCLDSLADIPGLEIVVVDNASSDNTREEIARRDVRLLANESNMGFAAAVNQGVRATHAPFVLLLNPDTRLMGGLDALVECFDDRRTGVAGGLLLGEDGHPQTGFMARNLPTPAALAFEILGINRLFPWNPANWHYRCRRIGHVTSAFVEQPAGAFMMFPRTVWEKLGGFDERFRPVWFEDVDFCARVKQAGLVGRYEPKAIAKHTGSHSIRSLSVENRERYWYGSLLKYALKHFRSGEFRAICASVVLGSIFRAFWKIPREGKKAFAIRGQIAGHAAGLLFRLPKAEV